MNTIDYTKEGGSYTQEQKLELDIISLNNYRFKLTRKSLNPVAICDYQKMKEEAICSIKERLNLLVSSGGNLDSIFKKLRINKDDIFDLTGYQEELAPA